MPVIIRKFEPQRAVSLIESGIGEQPSSSVYVVVGDSIDVDEQVNSKMVMQSRLQCIGSRHSNSYHA